MASIHMTPVEREAAHHLLWVWETYGGLQHKCMAAGEDACDWLEARGLAEDNGYGITITAAGRALMMETIDGPVN